MVWFSVSPIASVGQLALEYYETSQNVLFSARGQK